jgi:Protein of unknown function (DUF2975)
MRKDRGTANPLEPISTATGWLTTLMVGFLLLSLLVHQQAWGNGPVCASVSSNDASSFGGPASVAGVVPGGHATLGTVNICASHPAAGLRLAGSLATWPYLILWLVFLVQFRRLLTAAARPGALYVPDTAARLRDLGRLLVAGGLAAGAIETAASFFIFGQVVRYPGLNWFSFGQIKFSVVTLIVGLALATAARVMRQGVSMREELDVVV